MYLQTAYQLILLFLILGFCVKTKTSIADKVFINICHTDEVPPPEDISDNQLLEVLSSDEPSSYRLPISIGDLHMEADKCKCSLSIVF